MKTNSFQDPALARAVLGRKRVRRHIISAVPVRESIEYKIIRLKKELKMDSKKAIEYQVFFLGEWTTCSLERYLEWKSINPKAVRII